MTYVIHVWNMHGVDTYCGEIICEEDGITCHREIGTSMQGVTEAAQRWLKDKRNVTKARVVKG